jgi:hypothetical protein
MPATRPGHDDLKPVTTPFPHPAAAPTAKETADRSAEPAASGSFAPLLPVTGDEPLAVATRDGGRVRDAAPAAGERAAPGMSIGGRYTLRTAIGHGGMGTVWRATDSLLRRDVAVKEVLLPPALAPSDRDAMYQRTMREARAAAALSHPAVVQVYDVVTEGGRPWIVMELLQARSLSEMIVQDGPLAPRAVAKIGLALLGALEVAHAAEVLHRDVKPANVLICADGRCVLTDFGVARMPTDSELTTPGMVLGSPHFISPERAIGAAFGPPSDLFSLGVTLYTAVEGHPPFDKRDAFETMRAVVEDEPSPAVRAGALAGVLYGLLDKDPQRRWDINTARRVLRDLLAAALASSAPAHETDPYAVVRPQPVGPLPAPPATGQIGGRAMLAPGEGVSGAILRRQHERAATVTPAQRGTTGPGVDEERSRRGAKVDPDRERNVDIATSTSPSVTPAEPPAGAPSEQVDRAVVIPLQPGRRPAGSRHAAPDPSDPTSDDPTTVGRTAAPTGGPAWHPDQVPPWISAPADGSHGGSAAAWPEAAEQPGAWTRLDLARTPAGAWSPGPDAGPAQSGPGGRRLSRRGARRVGGGLGRWGARGVATYRQTSRPVRIAALVATVMLLLGVGVTASLIRPGKPAPPVDATPHKVVPAFPAVAYHDDRGLTVSVPAGWKQIRVSSYVDFIEPGDTGRRIRINIEAAGGSPRGFLERAEAFLQTRPQSCAAPYTRVDLRDGQVSLSGHPAAELEYTCGAGGQGRHALWRAVVIDNKAYHFFLSVPDDRFAESRPIYDELTRSFTVG